MTLYFWGKIMKAKKYIYHAFISSNFEDLEWARKLAQHLRQRGLRIFDEASIKLGADIPYTIENGIRSSRHVILILTPRAFSSNWVAFEASLAISRDPQSADRTLIPVLREDCEIPLRLQRIKYLDARSEDFESQLISLLESIDMDAVCEPQAEEVG
jgi:TIR domain